MPRHELFGWVWIFAGLLSGMVLGPGFHREDAPVPLHDLPDVAR